MILTLILINIVIILFSAIFLWKLEDGKPIRDRRFLKRYLTFWHMYNLFADFCFLIGLLLKLLEILIKDKVYLIIRSQDEINSYYCIERFCILHDLE